MSNMANSFFQFKQFTIRQDRCAMKVTTDACLFGAWAAREIANKKPEAGEILDIGAGTGLLTLMLAQKTNSIEIDKDAYQQAKENFASSLWSNRIKIIHGDVKTFSFEKKYDIIVSNPPFYENELRSENRKKNIALHDEGLLLDKLLDIIKQNLLPGGRFYLLLPYKRNNEIKKLFGQQQFAINRKVVVRQSTNHDYFRIIVAGKFQQENQTEFLTNEISIWNNKQQYTEEFISFLKDYYLHL